MKRLLALTCSVLVLLGLFVPRAAADEASQKANASVVAAIVDAHNAIRAQHKLPPFRFAPKVSAEVAQAWSLRMKANGKISHNNDYHWPGAQTWSENVGMAFGYPDLVTEVMGAFMASEEGHRENILDPGSTVISVGAVVQGSEIYTAINFYSGALTDAGTLYESGGQWLTALAAGVSPINPANPDHIYSKNGVYALNNRLWKTACSMYSSTVERCRTDIWGTQAVNVRGSFQRVTGWVFNNLTYAPSARSGWSGNFLGGYGRPSFSNLDQAPIESGGRQWRVECDTSRSGRNGCRAYILTNVVTATARPGGGYSFSTKQEYVFNNIVRFS